MIQQSYESIINKIVSSTELSKEEVESKINDKMSELQGLISMGGAATIIANELGIKLFDSIPKDFKIKEVTPNQTSINILGKVTNLFEVRNYSSGLRQGRLRSLFVGDETGKIRVTIWDDKIIDKIIDVKEGDILKITNSYSRANNNFTEIHLGNKSQIQINPPGETVGEVKESVTSQKKKIKDLQENDYVDLCGTVVQIFEPRYYQACPVCNKKVLYQDDVFVCKEHGKITPKQVPIVNIFFDDGTESIRAVAFRDQADDITGKEFKNIDELKQKVLGRQLILKGRVTKNQMFDRLEFTISQVRDANPEELINDYKSD